MLNIKTNIQGLSKLQKHIEFVEQMLQMKSDSSFQKYIQNKCLETVKNVARERLVVSNGPEKCTNEEYFEIYNNNHKIKNIANGFILYNDLTIPANTTKPENYPNGFNIALAFEYGVGIVGENANTNPNAWEYNLNNYNFGWIFKKNGEKYATYGYAGFEIYRFTAIEIEKNLQTWVRQYFTKEVLK